MVGSNWKFESVTHRDIRLFGDLGVSGYGFSCRLEAAEADELAVAAEVVGEIGQTQKAFGAFESDGSQTNAVHGVFHEGEDMFDEGADARFFQVGGFLLGAEFGGTGAFLVDVVLDSKLFEALVGFGAFVSAVGVEVAVFFVNQFGQRLAVVDIGGGDAELADEEAGAVGLDMVFVTIGVDAVFLGPSGVDVFLGEFVGGGFPGFGGVARLDLGVFLAAVALAGDFDECGVDDGTTCCKDTFGFESGVEGVEECEGGAAFDEGFTEAPEGGEVGDGLADVQAEEAGEGESVGDLIFDLRIAEVVEALKDEGFEHHDAVEGLAACGTFAGFEEDLIEDGAESFEIDVMEQGSERVVEFGEEGEALAFVKKRRLVVSHGQKNVQQKACQLHGGGMLGYFSKRPLLGSGMCCILCHP